MLILELILAKRNSMNHAVEEEKYVIKQKNLYKILFKDTERYDKKYHQLNKI